MKKYLYHLVDRSPWPLTTSFGIFFLTYGFVAYMNSLEYSWLLLFIGLFILICSLVVWWRDVIRESTYLGYHTLVVQSGLKMGFILFIGSEIMFFSGFFWAYFHNALSPSMFLGAVWPPVFITPLNPWGVPLLNTAILLLSGFSMTWAHFSLINGNAFMANNAFLVTLFLAILFTCMQVMEYFDAPFNISDSVFGSVFFMLTGLHGLHVIMGTIFMLVCYISFLLAHFTTKHHLGFEFASWYWHFVDVVWLFLYMFVYIWGSW